MINSYNTNRKCNGKEETLSQLVILEEFIGLSKFQLAEKEAYYVKNYHCFNKNIPNQWLNNPNYYPNYYRNWCSINKQFIYEKLNE